MPDGAEAAVVLLGPVKDCFGEGHDDGGEGHDNGRWRVLDVREV